MMRVNGMKASLLVVLLAAASCHEVLGIQDLEEGPAPGSVDSGGTGGDGGATGGSRSGPPGDDGDANGGSTGLPAALGGSGGALVGAGGDALGGNAGSADGGAPEADVPAGPFTVSGRVIDFFRRPVPNVPVTIDGVTAVTGSDGAFSIADVEGPYTASLVLNMTRNNAPAQYGYVYEGLTRSEPTLQVYAALPQRQASSLRVQLDNVDFGGEDAESSVILAFASPDGSFDDTDVDNPLSTLLGAPSWSGPVTTTGNAHALRVVRAAGGAVAAFEAHQAFPLAVTDGLQANVTFDMAEDPIATATVSGTVTGGVIGIRSNLLSLRFSDGVALPFTDSSDQPEAFTYNVPNLSGTSIIVAAADGIFAPYAVAHRGNIAPGQAGVELAVPSPVTLQAPASGATLAPGTTFSWLALAQTASTFVWHLESNVYFQGIFVVTARTQIELPELAGGFALSPATARWSVETHGDAPDVDTLAGPDGFLDAFSVGEIYPVGPNTADGYYTESERRALTIEE